MQARLIAGGIPAADTQALVPPNRPKDGNLIATLRGSDAKAEPILLLAHIDVVEADGRRFLYEVVKLYANAAD